MPDIVGSDQHKPTSLQETANSAMASSRGHALRGSEYNRGTGCGKTARPGLCGGCRVTGIPTAEPCALSNLSSCYHPCILRYYHNYTDVYLALWHSMGYHELMFSYR